MAIQQLDMMKNSSNLKIFLEKHLFNDRTL